MEQLWYTWSINGLRSGYQIRAASPGLKERDVRTAEILPYVKYLLPDGTNDIDPKVAPVSLSLFDTKHGRILLRKVYKGLDGARRPGAFFSHLVLLDESSAQWSIREAIELWASSFWRESENENDPGALPRVDNLLPTSERKNPFQQFEQSKRTALKLILRDVLRAFLTHKNTRRLYILAPSSVVTALIWGLAHALPRTLTWWKQITFTTYVDDVTKATEFIVGTFRFPTSSSQDLPESCYFGNNLAIHIHPETFQVRRFFLPELSNEPLYMQYASYAAENIVNGTLTDLLALVNDAEGQKINTIPTYLDWYEKEIVGKLLSPVQILEALLNKNSDEKQLKKPQNQDILVNEMIKNPRNWERAEAALVAFSRRTEHDQDAAIIRQSLVQKIYAEIGLASQSVNSSALWPLLQAMVILAPARGNENIWRGLLRDFLSAVVPYAPVNATSLFSWNIRALLLSQWVQMINPNKEAVIHSWLAVAWNDMGTLLRYVPQDWYNLVFMLRLRKMEPIPPESVKEISEIAASYAENMWKPMLQNFVRESGDLAQAAAYFATELVLHKLPVRLELLFRVVEADKEGTATQHLNATLSLQKDDLIDFVQTYIPDLMPCLYIPSTAELVTKLIVQYFQYQSPADLVAKQLTITTFVDRLNNDLQSSPRNPQGESLLALLADNIVHILQKIIQEWTGVAFYHYLQTLDLLVPIHPINANTKVWRDLLNSLPGPDQQFPWETHEFLLVHWASIAKYIQTDYILKWLDVPWSALAALLALPLPHDWQLAAVEKRIQDRTQLPVDARKVLEQHAHALFAELLEKYVKNYPTRQAETVARFVADLLQQQFPQRLELLHRVLIADESGEATLYLNRIEMEKADLFTYVENFLPNLLPYGKREHTLQFAQQLIARYFQALTPSDLLSHHSTKQLLKNLRENQLLHSKELWTQLDCWLEIARFLELRDTAVNLQTIQNFTDALARGNLSEENRLQLNDVLASVLAAHDFAEEEPELIIITYLLGKELADRPILLEKMAIFAGEHWGTSAEKIAPYIRLLLHTARLVPDEQKIIFLDDSLNYVMIEIDSRDMPLLDEIEKRIQVLPAREIGEWKSFLDRSRFAPMLAMRRSTKAWRFLRFAQARKTRPPTMPWFLFVLPYFWESRRPRQKLREAIQGRMATEIAQAYNPLLDKDTYLTENERTIINDVQNVTRAFQENNEDQILQLYYHIWDTYHGSLYFTPKELKQIRAIEENFKSRRNPG